MPRLIHRFCGKILTALRALLRITTRLLRGLYRWQKGVQLKVRLLLVMLLLTPMLFMPGCASNPPARPENLCKIFEEKRHWYKAALNAEKKWGAPLQIPMAMMYQESSFKKDAKPPKAYLFGFIPWGRKSSAYGYSQAKTDTWRDYVRETGNSGADRDNFADAIDFMGWFIYKTHKVNSVSKWDARNQYLNYHDGWGGYRKGTYKKKKWLVKTAAKVEDRASRYGAQYRSCKKDLEKGWFRRLFD